MALSSLHGGYARNPFTMSGADIEYERYLIERQRPLAQLAQWHSRIEEMQPISRDVIAFEPEESINKKLLLLED